jgi:hypothetical protein
MKFALLAFLLIFLPFASAGSVTIYKNEGCGHCRPYIEKLRGILEPLGYGVTEKDIMNDAEARRALYELQSAFAVPLSMQGHLLVAIDGRYLFEGHVPIRLITDFLKDSASKFQSVVVTQDAMSSDVENFGDIRSYLLLKDGRVAECTASTSVEACYNGEGRISANPRADSGMLQLFFVALIVLVPVTLVALYKLKK